MGTMGEMSRYTLVILALAVILVFTDSVEAAPKAKTLLVETMGEPEPAPEPEPEKKCSDCKSKFKYTNDYKGKPGPKGDYSLFGGDYGLCPGHHTCYSDYNDYNDDYKLCPGHPTCG